MFCDSQLRGKVTDQWPTMQTSVLISLLLGVLVCFAFFVFVASLCATSLASRQSLCWSLVVFDLFDYACILTELLSLISGAGIEKRLSSLALAA